MSIEGIVDYTHEQNVYFNASVLSNYLKHLIGINDVADVILVHYLADCLSWKTVPSSTMRAIEHVHIKHEHYANMQLMIGYYVQMYKPVLFSLVHTPIDCPLRITLKKRLLDNISDIEIIVISIWVKHGLIHRDDDEPSVVVNFDKQFFQDEIERSALQIFLFAKYFTYLAIDSREVSKIWFKNGSIHRDCNDQPAIIYHNGNMQWFYKNALHRKNGPAKFVRSSTGFVEQYWYRHGKHHRGKDQPAIILEHSQHWCQYGNQHRLNGPAYINTATGTKTWYVRGQLIKIQ